MEIYPDRFDKAGKFTVLKAKSNPVIHASGNVLSILSTKSKQN